MVAVFETPYGAPEHRSPSGREAKGGVAPSGERFFGSFLVATRKDLAFGCENPIPILRPQAALQNQLKNSL